MEGSKKSGMVTLVVTATYGTANDDTHPPKSMAYAYSSGGKLLDHQPVDAKGKATLTFPISREAASVRVLVGPATETPAPAVGELVRTGAAERMVRIDAGAVRAEAALQIVPDVWLPWVRGACTVRGTLLKRNETGGITLDLPVNNAEVEIYEVDPLTLIVPRLPNDVIEKIRDLIVQPEPPDPPIVRFPKPAPPDPIGPVAVRSLVTTRRVALKTVAETVNAAAATKEFQAMVRTASVEQLRKSLIERADIVRPLLCRYFPAYVRMDLVARARTNDCGHFQALFFRGAKYLDKPDLYFKAKQRLFGFADVLIYGPTPVACHTHWDYTCGTEITLYTTHPLAITSPPCPPVVAPNNWVLFTAVGNLSLSRIRGTSTALQGSTNPSNLGLTDGGAPFGGTLRFRVEFDNDLRDTLNVKYYQLSYRKGTSGPFTPMVAECHRHYTHEVGDDLVLEVYPLGPKVVNSVPNLFEIPPAIPPIGQWTFPDLTEDLTSGKFITTDLAPLAAPGVAWPAHGAYQVKLDLFDVNGAPVNIAAKGIQYRVPSSVDLSSTIETDDAATLGLVQGNSFVMTLHVDNSRCDADIVAPTIDGTPADDCCGVLEYVAGSSVTVPWNASHPHGFAGYNFGIVRGIQPVFGQSGPVGAGAFVTTQTVNTLMTTNALPSCEAGGCTVAGFSENLYVAAMATDGWGRLAQYDASAVRAFVLSDEAQG